MKNRILLAAISVLTLLSISAFSTALNNESANIDSNSEFRLDSELKKETSLNEGFSFISSENTGIPSLIYNIVTLDNLIWLSDMGGSVFSSKFNQDTWSDFKYTDGISTRGCSEKTWLMQYDRDIGGLSIEKCNDWVFIAAPAYGGFADMRDKAFTRLGNSLLNHRIEIENGLVLYRIVRTYRTYIIKIDWTDYSIFVSPEN